MNKTIATLNCPSYFGKCLGKTRQDPGSVAPITHYPPTEEGKSETILSYIEDKIPQVGYLTVNSEGLVYLDISDSYITELHPLLKRNQLLPPPYPQEIGAHITVVLPEESNTHRFRDLHPYEIDFSVTGCYYVRPSNWLETAYVWFLTIHAPKLEKFRLHYALSPKIYDQEFHITIATQKRVLTLEDIFTTTDKKAIAFRSQLNPPSKS